MSDFEYPLARAGGIRRARPPVGPWLLVCFTAGLLLQGAGDGAGSSDPADRTGHAAAVPGSGATLRDAAGREVSGRIRLPTDRVLVASSEMLGGGQAPDIWSTPLRLRGGADADAVASNEAAARGRPPEGQVAKDDGPSADPRFSHASLIDLGRGSASAGRPGVDRIGAEDLPAAAAPPGNVKAAVPPAVSASADDASAVETHAAAPAASVTGSIADAAPARALAGTSPQAPAATARLSGRWGPAAEACSADERRSSYIPLTIDKKGAKAGDATCRFGTIKPSGDRSWNVAASCSQGPERWKANVKLTLVGNKLTWKSARGTQTYLRCG